jgi:hypothetical protein
VDGQKVIPSTRRPQSTTPPPRRGRFNPPPRLDAQPPPPSSSSTQSIPKSKPTFSEPPIADRAEDPLRDYIEKMKRDLDESKRS